MKLAVAAMTLVSGFAVSCADAPSPETSSAGAEAEKLKKETRLANIEYQEVSDARNEYIARLTAERDAATKKLNDLRGEMALWDPVAEGTFYEMVEEIEESLKALSIENQRLREQLGLPKPRTP